MQLERPPLARYLDDLFGSPDYEAAYKAASQTLTESGDGRLCAEHDGGGYRQFVFLQDDKTYLYSGSMGPGQFITLTDDILRLFSGSTNGLVPAQSGTTTHESDEWYNFVGDGLYVYRCRNSDAANNFVYTAADCFFDAPLAAAQREGKWVYLDTAGHEVTAPCYDGIYQPNHYTDEPLVFARAAPLLSGYAVSAGTESSACWTAPAQSLFPARMTALRGTAARHGSSWPTAGTSTQFPA